MDVRCESCNSEYEFDEARIPPDGLPVKCSTCGHVFRVHGPSGGEGLPDAGGSGEWVVRQPNGNTFSFRELTTLQRWIVERKVSRDDEISKTGKQWKRLGDIAELATFFQVVDAQAQPAPQPTPQPAYQSPVATPTPTPGWGGGTGPQPQIAAPQTGPQMHITAGTPQAPQPQAPATQPQGAAWEQSQPQPQQVGWTQPSGDWKMHQTDPNGLYDDSDIEFKQGGKGKWVVLILLLLVGGGVGGVYYYRPDLIQKYIGGGVNELAANHVKIGHQELARDSYAAINRAIDNFEKASALESGYPEAKSGLAQAELARAEYFAEEAEALEAQLKEAPEEKKETVKNEIEMKRRESSQRSERAFNAAKEAYDLAPTSVHANRAMADYYRFKKAPEQMKPLLEKAREASPDDPGVNYVLGSSAVGDATARERAIRYFDKALEGAADMQRARYKLAKVYHAQGQKDKALLQIEEILKAVPDHERAKALRDVIEPPEPEPEPVKKLTFDQLLNQADRLRDGDRPGKALALYEQASEMEPDDPDVFVGMGWCYIDLEEPGAAISTFKTALRYAPRLSDAHMGLGEAYQMKGDKTNALKHYKTYLDIMPGGPEAPVARRMIEQLSK